MIRYDTIQVVQLARWAVQVGNVAIADLCEAALSGDKVAERRVLDYLDGRLHDLPF